MSFTPGPWVAVKDSREVDGIVCDTMNGDVVIPANGQALGCYTADARLIAAAPELLEALEVLFLELKKYENMPHPEGHDGARDFNVKLMHARSAITKARGEGGLR